MSASSLAMLAAIRGSSQVTVRSKYRLRGLACRSIAPSSLRASSAASRGPPGVPTSFSRVSRSWTFFSEVSSALSEFTSSVAWNSTIGLRRALEIVCGRIWARVVAL